MKLWKASTASSTQSRPLISRHKADPCRLRLVARRRAHRAGASVTSVGQSGLQLARGQDDEGLRPGMVVGHRQMNIDGVAVGRKGVKPRPGAAGQRRGRLARRQS